MGTLLSTSVRVASLTCMLAAIGCGSSGTSSSGQGGHGDSVGNSGGNSGGGGAGGGLSLSVGGTGTSGMSTASGSGAEVCDGVDNDGNGIVDDVDKNGDGVCDCLLIATLGLPGMWGEGDVFSGWLSARSDNGATDLADQVLTPSLLSKYQVIVAQDVSKNHEYSDAEVAALNDWVNQGGGFMTLIGYANLGEAANVNRLLAPLGMSYEDTQILPKSGGSTIPITEWVTHPIDNGVTAVGVDNGYPVAGKGTTIATGGGYDVGKAQEVGLGHVFLWGDEWITYNSEWQSHPDYQVQLFWLNSIKWLTVAGQCQVPIPSTIPQ